jgi:hypothetical protein
VEIEVAVKEESCAERTDAAEGESDGNVLLAEAFL